MEYESAGPPGGVPLRVGNYQPENVVEEGNMTSQSSSSSIKDSPVYIHGVRFWLISIAISIIMFIVNLEVPVVITALVAITDDLGGFESIGWVIASYLLGYVAVIVIFAKASDIFGRKFIFLLSTAIFIIFSAACSASQTIVQLIVFRAFQGIGGGGCFSLCTIITIEIVPPQKYTQYVTGLSIATTLALLLGPIVGGAIAANTDWRWIFIINAPIAAPAFLITLFALPGEFPYQGQANHCKQGFKDLLTKATLDRIDIPGTFLILTAALSLTAAFEEADVSFPWRSAYVITLLTVSGILWIALAVWERYVTLSNKTREPVLPWTFIVNRKMLGILLNFLLLGGPTIVGMFIIPQRFQLVYGTSGLDAGVRLIPFTLLMPFGTVLASTLAGRLKVPPLYLILTGSCLQVIGFALLGTLPTSTETPNQIYAFQVIAGMGCGMNFTLLFIMVPYVVEKRYNAVGMGAAAQFRFIGSTIILAIATSVFNTYMRPRIGDILDVSGSDSLIRSAGALTSLPPELLNEVRRSLAEGYNRQMLVLCASAALQIPASLLMWKKNQIVI